MANINSDEEEHTASLLSSRPPPPPPLVRMGLIADIQYAPIDDGHSYSGAPRYYRHALEATKHAALKFQNEQVDLVINLGDIVDGKNPDGNDAVDDVLLAMSNYTNGKIIHTYGNHCLYNCNRQELQQKLGIPFVQEPCGEMVGYYSYYCGKNIRIIVLDSYDVAVMQRCEQSSQKHSLATSLLHTHNGANMKKGLENSPEGLEGNQKRFVAFNGAVGELQLQWLRRELDDAKTKGERVLICSHQPILPESTHPVCLMWNYEDVLEVLSSYSSIILACFAGHAHKGGYGQHESGIHFRVLEAVLESPDPHKTYAILEVYEDRLEVIGYGHCQSATYRLDHLSSSAGAEQSVRSTT